MKLKRRRLRSLITKWKKILLQRDWKIEVQVNEDPEWENFATIGIVSGTRTAIMTVRNSLEEKDYETVVTHELIHVVLNPITSLLEEWQEELPPEQIALFKRQLEERVEVVTDNLEESFKKYKP